MPKFPNHVPYNISCDDDSKVRCSGRERLTCAAFYKKYMRNDHAMDTEVKYFVQQYCNKPTRLIKIKDMYVTHTWVEESIE